MGNLTPTKVGNLIPTLTASHAGKELEDLFGAEVWRAGEVGNTTNLTATSRFLGVTESELSDNITQSAMVDVVVYHLPSGALLHKSSLLLKER